MTPAKIGMMGLLQRFADLSPNPILLTDGALRVLHMNNAAETALGLPRDLVVRHSHPAAAQGSVARCSVLARARRRDLGEDRRRLGAREPVRQGATLGQVVVLDLGG